MPTRKQINRGFYGFETDDAEFLKPDGAAGTDPYAADGHSTYGYDAKFDDNAGTRDYAGHGDDAFAQDWRTSGEVASDNEAFCRRSDLGDGDIAHTNLGSLTDDVDGMGSGNKMTGGGGPLTKGKGVGDGKLRGAKSPKITPPRAQSNWRR
jgi:hypothetical protein